MPSRSQIRVCIMVPHCRKRTALLPSSPKETPCKSHCRQNINSAHKRLNKDYRSSGQRFRTVILGVIVLKPDSAVGIERDARHNPSAAKSMGFSQKVEFNSFKKFKSFKTF